MSLPNRSRPVFHHLRPSGTPADLADLGYDARTWDRPAHLSRGQLTTTERMPSAVLGSGEVVHEIPRGAQLDLDAVAWTDPLSGRGMTADQFLDRRMFSDALLVVHRGRIVHESYRNAMRPCDHHIVHSCSKTLTTMAVGAAVDEGRLDPGLRMQELLTELAPLHAWNEVTLQHVLDMAAGLDTEEHYEDPHSMYWRYADAVGYYSGSAAEQVGALEFVRRELVRPSEPPGTRFNYASYLTNLLPIVLERAYGIPAAQLYGQLYARIGAERDAILNLDPAGAPIVEGHLNVTLRDIARGADPMINEGRSFGGNVVVPAQWVEETFRHDDARARAFEKGDYSEAFPGAQYHNQAWVLEPERVAAMLGIHGQFAYLDRGDDLMIIGFASFPEQAGSLFVAVLRQLWERITHLTCEST